MNRGDFLNLGDLGKAGAKAAADGDIDKVIQLLDKADKILGNPLVQQFLNLKKPEPAYQNAVPEPAVQIIEKVPEGAVVPKSEVHGKLFSMMNKLDASQLMSLLSQYGGEGAAEQILQPQSGED